MPGGRPSEYDVAILPDVTELALSGATDAEIAHSLGIDRTTLYRWKHRYPEFCNALKDSKEVCDSAIVRSLFQKAREGDTTAMIFWLKNRQSKDWRDNQDHNHNHTGSVMFIKDSILDDEE